MRGETGKRARGDARERCAWDGIVRVCVNVRKTCWARTPSPSLHVTRRYVTTNWPREYLRTQHRTLQRAQALLLPKGLHLSGYLAATRQNQARTAKSGKYPILSVIAQVNTRSPKRT
jgi:hypothetical protein